MIETGSGLNVDNLEVELFPDSEMDESSVNAGNKSLTGNLADGYTFSFTITANFIGQYRVTAKDIAGNSNSIESQLINGNVVVDTTPPMLTLESSGTSYIAGGDDGYEGSVIVKIMVDDRRIDNTKDPNNQNNQDVVSSGISTVVYQIDDGNEETITPATAFDTSRQTEFSDASTILIESRGAHIVKVKIVDQAGNISEATKTFAIYEESTLMITPETSIIYDGGMIEEGADFSLNTGGSDGLVSYSYKEENVSGSDYQDGLPTNAGDYTIKAVLEVDNANKYKAKEITQDITIDKADSFANVNGIISGKARVFQAVLTADIVGVALRTHLQVV